MPSFAKRVPVNARTIDFRTLGLQAVEDLGRIVFDDDGNASLVALASLEAAEGRMA